MIKMEIIMKSTNSNFILRHAVFETNSSSCHSLALIKSENGERSLSKLYTDYQLDKNGNLHFNAGEYGWGFDVLSDFQSKLDYVMTYVIIKGSDYDFLNLIKALHDVTQFNHLYYFDQLVGYWSEEENKFKFSDYYSDVDDLEYDIGDAYIEHDSLDLLNGIIEDEDKLKNLLFVKESEIVIENDNHFFQVAGGNEKEVQKQIRNLLILMLPKSKHSMINDEVVNQFIKTFGRIGLSKMMKALSFSNTPDDKSVIKKELTDLFSSIDNAGTLYDLFELVNTLFGSNNTYRRFNTVKKAVCFAGSISCLDQLYVIPDFMEYVFDDFKEKVFKFSTGQWSCYTDLNKEMSKLVISEEQTLSNITTEQQIVFDKFIGKYDLNQFARYYLVGYLLLDKLKDVPLKKWTKQFTYEYHS
jgi:hypothetical protein